MEWSSSVGNVLFKVPETRPTAKLTNVRSFPASMTNGTVSDLDNYEWVVLNIKRGNNIRSVHEQSVGRNWIGPEKGQISTRIMGEFTTQLTHHYFLWTT